MTETPDEPLIEHPPVVTRAAYVLAFLAVVVGGLCGAAIGYGLVAIDCEKDCGTSQAVAGLIGAVVCAAGVAVVAVLVLRALAEWRLGGGRTTPSAGPDGQPPKVRRRKPSA